MSSFQFTRHRPAKSNTDLCVGSIEADYLRLRGNFDVEMRQQLLKLRLSGNQPNRRDCREGRNPEGRSHLGSDHAFGFGFQYIKSVSYRRMLSSPGVGQSNPAARFSIQLDAKIGFEMPNLLGYRAF